MADEAQRREDFEQLVTEILFALSDRLELRDGPDVDEAREAVMRELLAGVPADDRDRDAGGSGARRALPGEGSGMSGVEELAEQLAVAVKALEDLLDWAENIEGEGRMRRTEALNQARATLATLRSAA